ncbi:MAG: AI-2E family transporter [Erysipelotrichaceae bacterium]|nr:AI-2E family transporter [Erysipelotrichaceae bacterium]
MNKWFKDEETRKQIFIYTVTGMIVLSFYFLLRHIPNLVGFLKSFLQATMPFIWGAVFTVILLPLSDTIERWIGERMVPKKRRTIASILAVLFLIAVIILVVIIIIPQLANSIASLSTMVNNFLADDRDFEQFLRETLRLSPDVVKIISDYSSQLLSYFMGIINTTIPKLIEMFSTTITAVLNFFIGFIVAIYILSDREHLALSFRKLFSLLLKEHQFNSAKTIMRILAEKFAQFFSGKVVDSAIIGVICFVVMSILGLEYSVLISVVIGVTNIIPFFGPLIGAVPCALILLIVNPAHCLIFLIMVFVLQQVDGNIIGPRILGDSVGLSSLWIMFAIIVGGHYFGVYGMLFGVPIFSVIYYLLKYYADKKEEERS